MARSITELLVLTSHFRVNAKDSSSRFFIIQEEQTPICLNPVALADFITTSHTCIQHAFIICTLLTPIALPPPNLSFGCFHVFFFNDPMRSIWAAQRKAGEQMLIGTTWSMAGVWHFPVAIPMKSCPQPPLPPLMIYDPQEVEGPHKPLPFP